MLYARFRYAAFLLVALLVAACDGGPTELSQKDQNQDQVFGDVVLPSTTKILDQSALSTLTSASKGFGEITFSGQNRAIADLRVGDVIVADVTERTPYGFLRRIVDVQRSGATTVLRTEQATLEGAIKKGTITVKGRLRPSEMGAPALASGVSLSTAPSMAAAGDVFSYALNNEVLYDKDGNLSTTNDQVVANGLLSFVTDYTLTVDIDNFKVSHLRFTTDANLTNKLKISTGAETSGEREKLIATYPFPVPIRIFVGPFPVIIKPELQVYIGVNGEASVGVETGYDMTSTATAGLEYNGATWAPISVLTQNAAYTPVKAHANASLRGYGKLPLNFMLYGVAGPYVRPMGYLEVKVDVTGNPWWLLDWGIEVDVGVRVEAIGKTLADYSTPALINYRARLADAGGPLVGTPPPPPPAPVKIMSGTISASRLHTCGIATTGQAYCWGNNDKGTLGDGTKTLRRTPTAVAGGLTFASISAGFGHTCALTPTGQAYCWGEAAIGDGVGGSRLTPTAVAGGLTFASISAGDAHTCGVTTAGQGYCWGVTAIGDGTTESRSTPTAVAGGLTFASIDAGGSHACGITTAGQAYCWGNNYGAGLGDGTKNGSPAPKAIGGGLTFAAIDAGSRHTCGVTTAGQAYCWGNNTGGQLGDGTRVSRLTPTAVAGGLTFASISSGAWDHTCGVTTAGQGYCWGFNFAEDLKGGGRLGDGTTETRLTPTAVAGGLTFASIDTGSAHTCGVTTAGQGYCWGSNWLSVLGDGTATHRLTPTAVAGGLAFKR